MIGTLTIRADASPAIGTGHVMRMIALCQAWQRLGGRAVLIGRLQNDFVADRLRREGVETILLDGPPPERESPEALVRDVSATDGPWIALDGYRFDADCQRALARTGRRVLVMDDYGHLPAYHCDLLLNQNIGAEEIPYQGEIADKLLGPQHVLLRSEFLAEIPGAAARTFPDRAKNILVSLGGADVSALLGPLADRLCDPVLEGCALHVIAGGVPEQRWRELLSGCPAEVVILPTAPDMPERMRRADFCVTAGGSTCWELCALGVPFGVLSLAENQRGNVRHLVENGIAVDCLEGPLAATLASAAARRELHRRSMALIDGQGADRVVRAMAERLLRLDHVTVDDCEGVFAVASDPEVRRFFFSTGEVQWTDHVRWFTNRLARGDAPFYAIREPDGNVAGYIRFEREKGRCVLSIALRRTARGKGIGSRLLREAAARFFAEDPEMPSLTAEVRADNTASVRAFEKAGFERIGPSEHDGIPIVILQKQRS